MMSLPDSLSSSLTSVCRRNLNTDRGVPPASQSSASVDTARRSAAKITSTSRQLTQSPLKSGWWIQAEHGDFPVARKSKANALSPRGDPVVSFDDDSDEPLGQAATWSSRAGPAEYTWPPGTCTGCD